MTYSSTHMHGTTSVCVRLPYFLYTLIYPVYQRHVSKVVYNLIYRHVIYHLYTRYIITYIPVLKLLENVMGAWQ
jgi:hypothetical protein